MEGSGFVCLLKVVAGSPAVVNNSKLAGWGRLALAMEASGGALGGAVPSAIVEAAAGHNKSLVAR